MKTDLKGLMERPASFLNDRLGIGKKETDQALREDVVTLAGGRRRAAQEYYLQRTESMLLAGAAGLILAVVLCFRFFSGPDVPEGGKIERPGYGSDPKETLLNVSAQGVDGEGQVNLAVSGREYTAAQKQELLDQAGETLLLEYLGDNPGADEVRSSLVLPEAFENGAVTAEYVMIPYGIISDQGKILTEPSDEGELVEIRADLECQGAKKSFVMNVRVLPVILPEEEKFWKDITDAAAEADKTGGEEAYVTLPGEVDGKTLTWTYPRDTALAGIAFLCLLMPVFVRIIMDQQVKEQAAKRRDELLSDYPDLVWKMTLLMGAGLTISGAFGKIAGEYVKQQAGEGKNAGKRYAYEEMVFSCREMKSGVPEAKAYENFGRRCGPACYIRLGSLLSQNLKKGSRGLASTLEKEAVSSLEMRRNEARKKGEKASTKLMLPMVLMLGVVMAVLTVPAFLTM